MAKGEDATLSRQAVVELARLVGVELTNEHLDKLDADLKGLARNIETLQQIDVGETEPVLTFHPDQGAS